MNHEKEMNFVTFPWEQAARVFWTNELGEFLHETLPENALSLLFQYVLDGFQFSWLLWFQDKQKAQAALLLGCLQPVSNPDL